MVNPQIQCKSTGFPVGHYLWQETFQSKRQRRRERGRTRSSIASAKQIYKEPSCATCSYACWEKYYCSYTEDIDVEIGCNHPGQGNLGTYKERLEANILYCWHDSCTEYPKECAAFKLTV